MAGFALGASALASSGGSHHDHAVGVSCADTFAAAADVPDDFRLPPAFQLDVATATDPQIVEAIAERITASLDQLRFQRDANGAFTLATRAGDPAQFLAPSAAFPDARLSGIAITGSDVAPLADLLRSLDEKCESAERASRHASLLRESPLHRTATPRSAEIDRPTGNRRHGTV